jgi:hypothetical protein
MSLIQSLRDIKTSARKIYGQDIDILVCRAVAFGNDDNLLMITGKNHKACAADFAKTVKGAEIIEEIHAETTWPDGWVIPAYTSSNVKF